MHYTSYLCRTNIKIYKWPSEMQLKYCIARIIPLCVTWSYSRVLNPFGAPDLTIYLFSSFLPVITVGFLFPSRSSGLTLGF